MYVVTSNNDDIPETDVIRHSFIKLYNTAYALLQVCEFKDPELFWRIKFVGRGDPEDLPKLELVNNLYSAKTAWIFNRMPVIGEWLEIGVIEPRRKAQVGNVIESKPMYVLHLLIPFDPSNLFVEEWQVDFTVADPGTFFSFPDVSGV